MTSGDDVSSAWFIRPSFIRDDTSISAIQLRCRLTPKSSRDTIDGLTQTTDGPAIKARVRALPENNAANKALIVIVAKWLSVPKSSISLSVGAKSRTKVLTIVPRATADIERITAKVDELTTV